jgi:predicted branched-subunit amino acid permease
VTDPALRRIVRDALAIALADGVAAIAFGSVSVAAGLSVAQTCALSVLAFTGASQFALVGVIGGGGAGVPAVASALLLGARNALYSVRLATIVHRRRAPLAHLVIDESTGMAIRQEEGALALRAFLVTGLLVFLFWNAGTLIGAAGGAHLSDPRRYGLDAAGPAVFVALLIPQLRSADHRVVAALAVLVTVATIPALPAGVPVLVAGAVAVIASQLRTRR